MKLVFLGAVAMFAAASGVVAVRLFALCSKIEDEHVAERKMHS